MESKTLRSGRDWAQVQDSETHGDRKSDIQSRFTWILEDRAMVEANMKFNQRCQDAASRRAWDGGGFGATAERSVLGVMVKVTMDSDESN